MYFYKKNYRNESISLFNNSINYPHKNLGFVEICFFSLYIILPKYFAFEFSSVFPLLTASRIILLLYFIYILTSRNFCIHKIQIENSILSFFCTILIIDIIHLFYGRLYVLNDIFVLLIEFFLIYFFICISIDSKEKLEKCLKIIYLSSGVVALISIIGYFYDTNFFYLLKTTQRDMLMTGNTIIGYRLGNLRIEAGFSHPIYYGTYICVMIFLGLYFLSIKKTFMSFFCLLLNIIALFICSSRGCILAFLCTLVYTVIFNKQMRFIIKYLLFLIIPFLVLFFLFDKVNEYFFSVLYSILIYFGIFEDNSLVNYGANMDFLHDRWQQLSGIKWTMMNSPFIGFGPSSHSYGLVSFYNGEWYKSYTIDVGYIQIICDYGFLGFVVFFFLFFSVFLRRNIQNNLEYIMFKNVFIVYYLCLLSSSMQSKLFCVLFSLFAAFCKITSKKSE